MLLFWEELLLKIIRRNFCFSSFQGLALGLRFIVNLCCRCFKRIGILPQSQGFFVVFSYNTYYLIYIYHLQYTLFCMINRYISYPKISELPLTLSNLEQFCFCHYSLFYIEFLLFFGHLWLLKAKIEWMWSYDDSKV